VGVDIKVKCYVVASVFKQREVRPTSVSFLLVRSKWGYYTGPSVIGLVIALTQNFAVPLCVSRGRGSLVFLFGYFLGIAQLLYVPIERGAAAATLYFFFRSHPHCALFSYSYWIWDLCGSMYACFVWLYEAGFLCVLGSKPLAWVACE
jgi:hypothetical protein